jgi:hypothetical protein
MPSKQAAKKPKKKPSTEVKATKVKPASKAKAKAKGTREKAAKARLTAAERAHLESIDPAFDAPIDRNIAETQQEARELEAALAKLNKELYGKSKLDKAVGSSLEKRRKLLEATEGAWTEHRNTPLSKKLREVRAEAEDLKRDSIAALRHFCEHDGEVQERLDAIVLGTGLPDLVDDLKKLADLLEENGGALGKADLPRRPSERARMLAESLSRGSADRSVDPVGTAAMSLRNRAFWWLREAMDAIRSAGRYVFRKQPKLLAIFRASSTRARARAGTVRSVEKPAPTPTNGAP